MIEKVSKPANRAAVVVGILLFALATITYWDASQMAVRATYGMSASAASYLIASFLVVLGIGHLFSAFKPSDVEVEEADWRAIGWVGLALAGLIGSIAGGGGFVLGTTLLFVCTARAFGRRALAVDFCIGAVLSLLVYLFFTRLLTLALPQGPLENLF